MGRAHTVTKSSPARSMAVAAVAFMAAVAASLLAVAAAASPVPAIYVFGDSLADVGNNNHLVTLLKADFPHNGIDYPGKKATGRFSNGKNSVDFLGACYAACSQFPIYTDRFICMRAYAIVISNWWISDRSASFSLPQRH